jgi:HPt (histidine-containing phosphotransfer) domain-containing protein
MALHYNLAKVYALSENDTEFAIQILQLFVTEVPSDLQQIDEGIKNKNYQQAYSFAHKLKPTFDLIGMNVAYQEILEIEAWTKREGKKSEIQATFDSIKNQVEKAIKEIKKDFEI